MSAFAFYVPTWVPALDAGAGGSVTASAECANSTAAALDPI